MDNLNNLSSKIKRIDSIKDRKDQGKQPANYQELSHSKPKEDYQKASLDAKQDKGQAKEEALMKLKMSRNSSKKNIAQEEKPESLNREKKLAERTPLHEISLFNGGKKSSTYSRQTTEQNSQNNEKSINQSSSSAIAQRNEFNSPKGYMNLGGPGKIMQAYQSQIQKVRAKTTQQNLNQE